MSRLPFSLAAALLAAGCMGGSDPPATVDATPTVRPDRPFAELRVAAGEGLDSLDPQLGFTQESWRLSRLLHLGLVAFGPDGSIVPALAEDLPEISDDGLVYQFTLRAGVQASDFADALERLRRLDSPGEHWFAGIEEVRADDDARTVEYELAEPDASFLMKLATPLAAPPQPSGPYVAETSEDFREVLLRPNPRYRPLPALPAGNAALIRVQVGAERWDVAQAAGPPSVAYVFLNTQLPPFDVLEVRRAVAFALDRPALAEAAGARPTQNVLPAGVPGHESLSLYRRNLVRARRLVRRAGAEGKVVTVWSSSDPDSRRPARLLVETLRELGLGARYRELPPAEFFRTVAGRTARAQAGVSSWSSPLPHPLLWFDALLNGDRIGSAPNTNLSYADDPELNERIALLRLQPILTDQVAVAWAELDRLAAERALVLPFAVRRGSTRVARRLDRACVLQHVVFGVDLARLCLR
ncbi:MAG: ABC transporter substrate-binding protein [Gaiellaceae bacterium]